MHIHWPKKYNILGVSVSATNYDELTDLCIQAARNGISAVVSHHAVHAVVTSSRDPALRKKVNTFDVVAPDGQPVRWALNWLHRAGLRERVYGPEFMIRLCRCAAQVGISVYLYGSLPEVLANLRQNLTARIPGLAIAGTYSPPFRPLTDPEKDRIVQEINDSGAGIVLIGLGCPKQDHFAAELRHRIRAVLVCVGAAFDFYAGNKQMAPAWMQQRGLEWVYRLSQEPGRLWQRYLVTNSQFLLKFTIQWLGSRILPGKPTGRLPEKLELP